MTNTKQLKEIINKLIENGYSEFEIIDAEMPMYRREYKFRDGCEFRVNYPSDYQPSFFTLKKCRYDGTTDWGIAYIVSVEEITNDGIIVGCEGPWADTKNWIIRPLRHVIQKADNLLEIL